MYHKPDLDLALINKDISNYDFTGKNILIRSCLNVIIDKLGNITDNTRLIEALPTLRLLAEKANSIVIMAHLGRPTTARENEFSLENVRKELEVALKEPVIMLNNEEEIRNLSNSKRNNKYYLIENIRFFEGEESQDPEKQTKFAELLASTSDIYVNDAFPDYREAVSTYTIAKHLKSFLGCLFIAEIKSINYFQSPTRPFVAVMGGAKLSEKLDTLYKLLEVADKVVIGGAMAYTMLKASGKEIGKSLCEEDKIQIAKEMLEKYSAKIILPVDHLVGDNFSESTTIKNTDSADILPDQIGLDIGTETIKLYTEIISSAKSILWNGPMGVFEWASCENGTKEIGKAIVENQESFKFAGGGDSIAAINKFNLTGFNHISTGGGAMLSYIAKDSFPTLEVILD